MIERRRRFLRSDFLRNITQPVPLREVLCSLGLYYQGTMESRLPNPNDHQRVTQNRMATRTGLVQNR
jgi:hypothetical protein